MNILHLIVLFFVIAVIVRLIVEIKRLYKMLDEDIESSSEMNDMLLQSMRRTEQLQADYDRLLAKLEPYQAKPQEWQNPNPWTEWDSSVGKDGEE